MDATTSIPGYSIVIPGPPFSPWLRLAHVWSIASDANRGHADLRRLLDFEFFLQIEGSSWIALPSAGGRIPLPAGHLAFIPPGLIHAYGHLRGAHVAVHADFHARPALTHPGMVERLGVGELPRVLPGGWNWRLCLGGEDLVLPLTMPVRIETWRDRFQPLIDMYASRSHGSAENRLRAAAILGESFASILAGAGRAEANPLLAGLADAAAGPPRSAHIPQLAQRAGLGETAYRAEVRRLTGRGPREQIERLRLDRAAYALRSSSEPIARIASAAGYSDPFHFSRVFRRVFGTSPRSFRGGPGQ
ncbi:MAG TPA: hypothetical protein DCS97_15060 [Planctomycetes bacterium]|nr:hypothetical protein [Planctomycetota bacterium]